MASNRVDPLAPRTARWPQVIIHALVPVNRWLLRRTDAIGRHIPIFRLTPAR